MAPLLVLDSLSFGYEDRTIFDDLSFSMKAGEWVLLIGPNGCGKTTFIRLISGFLQARTGNIYFKNKQITDFPAFSRMRLGIKYLRQTRNIFPAQTVLDNLQIALLSRRQKDFTTRLDFVLDIFPELSTDLNRYAGLLSGGLRQKLALAMVVAGEGDLWLFDEPTAGLAPNSAKEIFDRLGKIKSATTGDIAPAALIVEHNYKFAKRIITRVLGMREGRILLDEDKEPSITLSDKPFLERLFFG